MHPSIGTGENAILHPLTGATATTSAKPGGAPTTSAPTMFTSPPPRGAGTGEASYRIPKRPMATTAATDPTSRPSPAVQAHKSVVAPASEGRPIKPPQSRVGFALEDAPAQTVAAPVERITANPIPESLADEENATRIKSATRLLDALPPNAIAVAGQAGSRVPADAAGDPREIAIRRLAEIANGGKTGSKNDDLRKAIGDISRYNAEAGVTGGAFPIAADHAEAVRTWLEGGDKILAPKAAEPTTAAPRSGSLPGSW